MTPGLGGDNDTLTEQVQEVQHAYECKYVSLLAL